MLVLDQYAQPMNAKCCGVFLAIAALAVGGGRIESIAQEATENEPLIKLQKGFDDAYAKVEQPILKLNANYAKALQRLFKKESTASRLDSALQVKAEMDGFGDGSKFSPEAFAERDTENSEVSNLRRMYRQERERLRNLGRGERGELLAKYQAALLSLEDQQTTSGQVEMALTVRKVREALDSDVRFADGAGAVADDRSLSCQVHFVSKGDIEFTMNGGRISYRNVADQRKKYNDGTVRPMMVRVGDILQFKMRSEAVFRSLIIALESEDGTVAIPIKMDDYRYLGMGNDVDSKILKPEDILQMTERPGPGDPDYLMADMWLGKKISATSRDGSDWIKIGPSNDWYHYVIVIRNEMLQQVREAAAPGK